MLNSFPPHSKIRSSFILGIVLLVTAVCYFPTLHNDFVLWDDDVHLLDNTSIRLLDSEHLQEMFTQKVNALYLPLTSLSFALEYYFAGYNPFIYHLDNLLLHLLVCCLVFFLALRLGLSYTRAAVASLIFGIHPMRVESVAWVTERKDVLYAFFYLGAVWVYLRYLQSITTRTKGPVHPPRDLLIWVALLGVLSILAKPMALSLPLILLLFDYFYGRKIEKHLLIEKIPLFLLIGGITLISYVSTARIPIQDIGQSLLIWIWTFVFYIRQFLFPIFLVPVYDIPKPISFLNPEYGFSAIVFILLWIFWARLWRCRTLNNWRGWFNFAFLFYFLSIFFLLRFDSEDKNIVADRFMYLPGLGFCYLLGYIFEKVWSLQKRRFAIILMSIFAFGLFFISGLKTYQQSLTWKNSLALWQHELKFFPNNYVGLGSLATALQNQEEYKIAKVVYKKLADMEDDGFEPDWSRPEYRGSIQKINDIISLYERSIQARKDSIDNHYNLGKFYQDIGKYKEAVECYKNVISVDPLYKDAYFNLGNIFVQLGNSQEAIRAYEQVIQINPKKEEAYINVVIAYNKAFKEYPQETSYLEARKSVLDRLERLVNAHPKATSYFNLGFVYAESQDWNQAIVAYRKALEVNPRHAKTLYNLANLYKNLGFFQEAVVLYQKTIDVDPKNSDTYVNLGVIYQKLGDNKRANEYYLKSLRIDSKNLKNYFNLATIAEKEGHLEDALYWYEKFVAGEPANPDGHYNLANVCARLKKNDRAMDHYLKAVELKSDYLDAWVNLSLLSYVEKDFKNALKYFEEARLLGYVPPPEFAAAIEKYK